MANQIVILLGSNIDKEINLPRALRYINEWCEVIRISSIYETAPIGLKDQPAFLNAAVLVESPLTAADFKHVVLDRVESRLDRRRTSDKNAPRTIDADMILFNQDVFDLDQDHHIPDPDLLRHLHVVVPIAEIKPELIHPETGEAISSIAKRLVGEAEKAGLFPFRLRHDIKIQLVNRHSHESDNDSPPPDSND